MQSYAALDVSMPPLREPIVVGARIEKMWSHWSLSQVTNPVQQFRMYMKYLLRSESSHPALYVV